MPRRKVKKAQPKQSGSRKQLKILAKMLETKKAIQGLLKRNEDITKVVLEAIKAHTKSIEKMAKKCDSVDDTLCNVFLAIRQNEYLQAWYPPQKGFPEMKVTGSHPKNLDL